MRGAALLVLAFLSSGPLAGCLGAGQGQEVVTAPAWLPGFAFSYRDQVTKEETLTENKETSFESDPQPSTRYALEVLSTELLNAAGDPVYLQAIEFQRSSPGENRDDEASRGVGLRTLRQSDLSYVPFRYDTSVTCVNQVCAYRLVDALVGEGRSHRFLDFPLTRGKTWSGDLPAGWISEFPKDLEFRLKARVLGWQDVDTDIGRLSTIRIDFEAEPVDVEAWERDQIRQAKGEEEFEVDDLEYEPTFEQQAYYSPEVQAVVKTFQTQTESFRVWGSRAGDAYALSGRSRTTVEEVLTGVRLTERPQRDLDYAARLVHGAIPVLDALGQAATGSDQSITIEADATRVNAADRATLSFRARATSQGAEVSDAVVDWRLVDYGQAPLATARANSFQYQFDRAGAFLVEAALLGPEGRVVAAAELPVWANFARTESRACNPVGAVVFDAVCPDVRIPVHLGARLLRITATPSPGGLPTLLTDPDQLVVRDAAGRSVRGGDRVCDGNVCSFVLRDFGSWAMSDRDWTVQWSPDVAIQTGIEYGVEISYEPPTAGGSGTVGPATGVETGGGSPWVPPWRR